MFVLLMFFRRTRLVYTLCAAWLNASCVYHELESAQCDLKIKASVIIHRGPSTCGAADGSATISVLPRQAYKYSIGTLTQENNFFDSLAAGRYLVYLDSPAGCRDTVEFIVPQTQTDLRINGLITQDDGCLQANGIVQFEISGGIMPYKILQSTLALDANLSSSSVRSGSYSITVEDEVHCNITYFYEVPRGNSGVSWTKDIKPIIQTSCAKSGCHVKGSGRKTLETYADVKDVAGEVRRRTQNGSMPYDGPLSQVSISLIACWIDDGALEN
jgi:hypothetical protein